jgi:tetratricopeptide (TPR) repeat protein
MQLGEDAADELRSRLARHPAERYPVQHATAQFHLGVLMTNSGRLDEAASALGVAAALFNPQQLPTEHAKSLNALAAVRRLQGKPEESAVLLKAAARLFEESNLRLEKGAALFNLGQVYRDLGYVEDAIRSFDEAVLLLDEQTAPAQAAAARRELGVALLSLGQLERAVASLEQARDLADRAQDRVGLGAAANALGLVHLAKGDHRAAIDCFELAVATNPRSIRPDGYAMAKANLALALQRAGETLRSWLAARQALRVGGPEAVRSQAATILGGAGDEPLDLHQVLDEVESDRWPGILQEEASWWAEDSGERARSEALAWVRGLAVRPDQATELTAAWLGALLELSPEQMGRVVTVTLQSVAVERPQVVAAFRSALERAMPRFHSPQFLRLKETFDEAASRIGIQGWR